MRDLSGREPCWEGSELLFEIRCWGKDSFRLRPSTLLRTLVGLIDRWLDGKRRLQASGAWGNCTRKNNGEARSAVVTDVGQRHGQ